MATRRALASGPPNLEILNSDALTYGLIQNNSKEVDAANGLSSKTIVARRTYLTGSAALTFTINLPAAVAANDGLIVTIMSTVTRILVTWASSGGSAPGIAGPNANTPVSVQYDDATKTWYKVN